MYKIRRFSIVFLILISTISVYHLTTRRSLKIGDIQSASIFSEKLQPQRPSYQFLLEPSVTINAQARWTSMTFVKSANANKDRRDAIRDTWAGMRSYRDARFVTVFIVGQSTGEDDIVRQVRSEHERYGDILLLDLLDTIENVHKKTVAGMQWAANHLPKTWIYSSTDDDMLLHVPNFASYIDQIILKTSPSTQSQAPSMINMPIMCIYSYQQKDPPARDPDSKWYMPEELYPGTYWPPYCRGGWYSMPVYLAGKLLRISKRMEFLSLDDVWITGLMRIRYLNELYRNESYPLNEMLDAAPLSLRTDGQLNNNIDESVSRVIVSHAWGNIAGRNVDVKQCLRLRWKEWSAFF